MMPSNKCSHHTDQTIQQLKDRTDLYNAPTRCTFYESILENMLKLFISFVDFVLKHIKPPPFVSHLLMTMTRWIG
jgi:hypothetical protein